MSIRFHPERFPSPGPSLESERLQPAHVIDSGPHSEQPARIRFGGIPTSALKLRRSPKWVFFHALQPVHVALVFATAFLALALCYRMVKPTKAITPVISLDNTELVVAYGSYIDCVGGPRIEAALPSSETGADRGRDSCVESRRALPSRKTVQTELDLIAFYRNSGESARSDEMLRSLMLRFPYDPHNPIIVALLRSAH